MNSSNTSRRRALTDQNGFEGDETDQVAHVETVAEDKKRDQKL